MKSLYSCKYRGFKEMTPDDHEIHRLLSAWGNANGIEFYPGLRNLVCEERIVTPEWFHSLADLPQGSDPYRRASRVGYSPRLYRVLLKNAEPAWLFRWSAPEHLDQFVDGSTDHAPQYSGLIAGDWQPGKEPGLQVGDSVTLSFANRERGSLRIALIGGPEDSGVDSVGWARAAFNFAHAVLEIEKRSRPEAFGFISDGYRSPGSHRPIRSVVREVTGEWPVPDGRWRLSADQWPARAKAAPAVSIFSHSHILVRVFGWHCDNLVAAAAGGHFTPLVIIPDGPMGRRGASWWDVAERDSLARFLPLGVTLGPTRTCANPSLTSVMTEAGDSFPARTVWAAVDYLSARHRSHLSVFDILSDPLLLELATAKNG